MSELTKEQIKNEIKECKDKLAWLEKKLEEPDAKIGGVYEFGGDTDKYICVGTSSGPRLFSLDRGHVWSSDSTFGSYDPNAFRYIGPYRDVFNVQSRPTKAKAKLSHLYRLHDPSSLCYHGSIYICLEHLGELRLFNINERDGKSNSTWDDDSTFGGHDFIDLGHYNTH